ncbi:DUF3667 domain-containing protein [Flavihumibacter rivuli]|uniref:DUF3667 domain-containing protein n=1 Tax=Flavihumibacter rivuli TaxID=2838156 RepID=UPI001BDDD387|nr:DUF3667 domain-containing protein [Flavihumibacter rivuli]ULQ56930.1 DUF3667 domain-containing protein [Flavihumibacter rivuli]
MSHYQERKEKDCLNCGTIVEGRYCHNCGQENLEPRETLWGLITHFVYDITHFDGKFFSTLKYLLFRPGFLSSEYIKGRRNSYLHPIRMYVFTSAFFFLIFFTIYRVDQIGESKKTQLVNEKERLERAKKSLLEDRSKLNDVVLVKTLDSVVAGLDKDIARMELELSKNAIDTLSSPDMQKVIRDSLKAKGVPVEDDQRLKLSAGRAAIEFGEDGKPKETIKSGELDYSSMEAYVRMQKALPADKRDGWLTKAFTTKMLAIVEEGNKDEKKALQKFISNLVHSIPKMLFISLPIFAFILKLLYRRRKDLMVPDHGIFAIHLYCATFIVLLVWFGVARAYEATDWGPLGFVMFMIILLIYFYLYKAMRNFYGQSRKRTIAKFILLNMLSFVMMLFLLVIFTVISAAQMSGSAH